MTGELEGRTVLVTGGSRGIGLACAHELVARGADVFIAAREREVVDRALTELRARGPARVDGTTADVGDALSVEGLFRSLMDFGDLAGVVHAAGVYGPIGPVTTVQPTAWLEAVRINLFGTFLITRAACSAMTVSGKGGSIVLLAGGGAATPFPNYTAYASSKAAVVRFAETVAAEVGPYNIRVNTIAPGFVATRLHDQTLQAGASLAGDFLETTKARLADGGVSPTVAAQAAAYLLSDRAHDITGRFLAAPYDDWEHWSDHIGEIVDSDLFTLRRIVPKDRGREWQ